MLLEIEGQLLHAAATLQTYARAFISLGRDERASVLPLRHIDS
jgi:hypothetical protein